MAQSSKNNVHGENGASFEQSFGRLQEVVQKLSEGNLTLQEALSSFEEGMTLADLCTRMLDEAQLRVEQVSARSRHTGAQALDELDRGMLASPLVDVEEEDVVTFEIESYERRTIIEAVEGNALPSSAPGNLAYTPLPWEKPGAPSSNGSTSPPAKGPQGFDDLDLDPLFDEDE